MAQVLSSESCYSLHTSEKDIEKRHVFLVKLTDSCLKAVEDHVSFKGGSSFGPRIVFEGTNGVITIPCRSGPAGHNAARRFKFAVSTLQSSAQQQGTLECICHPGSNSKELVSYGGLQSKLAVMATEDVYETTRNRMAQANQERNEIRTKEIKLNSTKKKAKMKILPVSSESMKMMGQKKLSDAPHKIASHTQATTATKPKPISSSPKLIKSSVSPANSSSSRAPSGSQKSFSCRERIIHILAIRPHQTPDLVSRLLKEALPQKEKDSVSAILPQVSSKQDKQNVLHRHLYHDVQVDSWPFYTELERETVKRNITQQRQADANSETSPQMVTSTSHSPDENGLKRLAPPDAPDVASKRTKLEKSDSEPTSTSIDNRASVTKPPKENPSEQRSAPQVPDGSSDGFQPSPEEESPPTVASTSETPEYVLNYKRITAYEQRCIYKQHFQAEYPEYLKLKGSLDAVTRKFMELDRSWKRAKPGTAEYEKIHDEICDLYEKHQKDEKYQEMKRRCQFLHQKLAHIKSLIADYDNGCRT